MSDLASQLTEYARGLLTRADAIGPPGARAANADVLQLLIEWSVARAAEFEARGPDGADPLVGVATRETGALLWRVYPRQEDGAKVALLPGVHDRIPAADRQAIVAVLEQLQPGRRIGPSQQLEIGLHRLAAHQQWQQFKSALARALDAVARLDS